MTWGEKLTNLNSLLLPRPFNYQHSVNEFWESETDWQALLFFKQPTSCLPSYSVSNIAFITCLLGFFLSHPITKIFSLDILPGWTFSLSINSNWMLPSRMCILLGNIKFCSILANFTLKSNCLFYPEVTKLNTTTSVLFMAFFLWKLFWSDLRRNHLPQIIQCQLDIL